MKNVFTCVCARARIYIFKKKRWNERNRRNASETEDEIVRARQQTRESPKDNERPLRTGIHQKK